MVSLALYQPDIAGNCGTLMRLGACMNTDIHIIHPCGFPFSKQELKRSAMDYFDHVICHEHDDYQHFMTHTAKKRKILLTTKATVSYCDFQFKNDDILLLGRESAGVPQNVHDDTDYHIIIPMHPPLRSMNIAIAAAIVLSEALRQTKGFFSH